MRRILQSLHRLFEKQSAPPKTEDVVEKKEVVAKKKATVVVSNQEYSIGDSVRFNDGEVDEDSGVDLSGWQGRIIEISKEGKMFGIALDSITLSQLPEEYLETSEVEGMDWSEYYVEWDSVTKVKPRDSKRNVEVKKAELTAVLGWLYLGEEGREINEILQGAMDEVEQYEAWLEHLLKTLKFPIKAKVSDSQRPGSGLKVGDRVKITGINFVGDLYGLTASLKGGREILLADLEVVPSRSPYYDTIRLYAVWFANR